MGYSALYDLGCILTGLGLGGRAAVITVLAALSVRTLALALIAVGVSAVRMRVAGDGFAQVTGLVREIPMAVMALMIGGGILAGVPLLAGFGPRWQIIHASAEVNPVLPTLLVLGGLGVAIGYLRGLRATMTPEHGLTRVTFAEPRLLLILISLLIVVSVLLGLFPALLIEPLQLLTMSVSVPIQ
jgi:formate hydrogenlyase subunit 3/multisubunit Na+/H+ antiporter MnhD subunit